MINVGELLSRAWSAVVRFFLDSAIRSYTDPLETLIRQKATKLNDEQDEHFTSNRDLINEKFSEADERMDGRESNVDQSMRQNGERIATLEGMVAEQSKTIQILLEQRLQATK